MDRRYDRGALRFTSSTSSLRVARLLAGCAGGLILASAGVSVAAKPALNDPAQAAARSSGATPFTSSAAAGRAASRTAPAEFAHDVAGVRIGMSPDAARAAFERAGYRLARNDGLRHGPSFASRVRQEAQRRRTGGYVPASTADQVVVMMTATGPNRESLTIELAAEPAGSSVVSTVVLTIPEDVMTGPALLRQALEKYGRPDGRMDSGLSLAWCSAPVRSVCGSLSPFQVRYGSLPYLTVTTALGRRLDLREGTERGRLREREVTSAVDRAAPKTDRAAF